MGQKVFVAYFFRPGENYAGGMVNLLDGIH